MLVEFQRKLISGFLDDKISSLRSMIEVLVPKWRSEKVQSHDPNNFMTWLRVL